MKRLLSVFISLVLVISSFSSNLTIKGKTLNESYIQSSTSYPQLQLSFTPTDSAMDTTKPIVYLTDKTNKRVYSINYVTGSISYMTFGLMPESISYYNNQVFVSLMTQNHSSYWWDEDQSGAIAIIDANNFTLNAQFNILIDPFDIVAANGYIYVSCGSGQWTTINSYSISTKTLVSSSMIRQQSYIKMHPTLNKVYTVDTDSSPRDIKTYLYNAGALTSSYDSPYHGNYSIGTNISISPDGKYIFTSVGTIFTCNETRSADMKYVGKLNKGYNDIAFNLNNSTFYTGDSQSITQYNYSDYNSETAITAKGIIKNLFYSQADNKLVTIYSKNVNSILSYFLEAIDPPNTPIVNTPSQGRYAVISNESTNGTSTSSTGTFSTETSNAAIKNDLSTDSYRKDFIKPLNKTIAENISKYKIMPDLHTINPVYSVGDTKSFWTYNLVSDSYSQVIATLKSSGTKANVWVNLSDYNMSATDANKIAAEFDNKISPKITSVFGQPSDIDSNSKVNILCFDIKDGFSQYGGYVAGYFDPNDLYINNAGNPYSNQMEAFYIDTYPGMGVGTKDVTQCYGTIAHEFQHMINFNQNVFIESNPNGDMDTWLNEGLSEAASQVYTGQVTQSRIDYYNESSLITSGCSLINWEGELENYSLSYLFLEYLKEQVGIGDSVFKEVLISTDNDYLAVEQVIQKYISPTLTFGNFMTSFRAALLLKNPTGLYGFKGNAGFNSIQKKIYTGTAMLLNGGGAVVKATDPVTGLLTTPSNKGDDVTYLIIQKLPIITIMPYITTPTTQSITVTATTDRGTLNTLSHTFTTNGSFDFVSTDEQGNATTKTVTITNIIVDPVTEFIFDANTGTITRYIGSASDLVIPSTINGVAVKSIGGGRSYDAGAFFNCSTLNSVTIPNSVTSIGDYAFCMSSFTGIFIPNSVTSIGEGAFEGCTSLLTITIPNGMTSIGNWPFSSCTSLTSVVIPNSVTSIGNSAFYGCTSLSDVKIPNSVTIIGGAAFYNCTSLMNIIIPSSVTTIASNSFASCSNLSTVTIFNKNTIIDDYTFTSCDYVEIIGYTGSTADVYASNNEIPFRALLLDFDASTGAIIGYIGTEAYPSIPSQIGGVPVTSIADNAFMGCNTIINIIIPDSVTRIGNNAFNNCTSLINITIRESVTSIGEDAFANCEYVNIIGVSNSYAQLYANEHSLQFSLNNFTEYNFDPSTGTINSYYGTATGLEIPSTINGVTVKVIGVGAFAGCSSLQSITIPRTVESIDYFAFQGCQSLTEVNVPDNVKKIGYCAFDGTPWLYDYPNNFVSINGVLIAYKGTDNNIKIPNNIISIGEGVFEFCDWITEVKMPASVIEIGSGAFYFCSSLSNISIPTSVVSIGNSAFEGTAWLDGITDDYVVINGILITYKGTESVITISDTVTDIGSGAFNGNTTLTAITIPSGVKTIGEGSFSYCSSLNEISLPNSIVNIGEGAFYECYSLTSIAIPDGVKTIGDFAFNGCNSLIDISIPNSVESIGLRVFGDCNNLTQIAVDVDNQTYASEGGVLYNKSETNLIQCPAGKTDSYIIPDGVENIGDWAFKDCSGLTSIAIPISVITIGVGAFSGCTLLTDLSIPKSITSISDWAFEYCGGLSEINVDEENQFYSSADGVLFDKGKTRLMVCPIQKSGNYDVPNSVKMIDAYAFENCSFLTNITIPNGLISFGYSAFVNCTSLTSVIIPQSITSLDDGLFEGCSSLNSITIPKSVVNIGDYVFYGCENYRIYGCANSYVQIYANSHNIPFYAVKPPVITIGTYNSTTPTNKNITVTATSSGTLNFTTHTFIENGSFNFSATDIVGNITIKTVSITNIDKTAPVITGVGNGGNYNTSKTISFNEGTATLNNILFTNGGTVSAEGNYTLKVIDAAGNITQMLFNIDKTAPIVTGVTTVGTYNSNKMITFNEGTATLNNTVFISGTTVVTEGSYTLIVTDGSGNATVVAFKIDKTAPVITIGSYDGLTKTNKDILVSATTNEGTLIYTSHIFTENGNFDFIAIDSAGNISTKTVKITNIDKISPSVYGIIEGVTYSSSTITFNEGTAWLNGNIIISGKSVVIPGSYTFEVVDAVGNKTTVHFVICPITFNSFTTLGAHISNIKPITTVQSFLGDLTFNTNTTFQLKSAGGKSLNQTDKVGTGTTVDILVNGIKSNTYTTVVYGDVDGDSAIDLYDLVLVRNHLLENDTLDGAFKLAGDIYNEGDVTLNDLVGMMAYVSESGSINQNN